MFDAIQRDIRHALRLLSRAPGFTAAAVVSLALGIGANVAIVTLLDAVAFRPLLVSDAGDLVGLFETAPNGAPDTQGGTGQLLVFSYPRFERLRQALGSDGTLTATTRSTRFLIRTSQPGQPQLAQTQLVSGDYFAALGVPIAAGRSLSPEDARLDRDNNVAVVSEAFATRVLGGVASAIGGELIVNDLPVTVIGVAAPGFAGVWTDTVADVWLPLSLQQTVRYQSNVSSYGNADRNRPWASQDEIAWLTLIARIPSSGLARARARLDAANQAGVADLAASFPDQESRQETLRHRLAFEPLSRGFSGLRDRFGSALLALTAMVSVMLLLTCANLANLLLARAHARQRETAVRSALGATRWALFRQYLIEAIVLAAVGGLAGLVAADWITQVLASDVLNTARELLPPGFTADRRMLAFAVLITSSTVLLFGVFPSWRSTGTDAVSGLSSGTRTSPPVSMLRSMRPFVILQLAMSFVLVMAAALFGQTLARFARLDLGFDPNGVVEVSLDPELSGYSKQEIPALSARVLDAVRSAPGVRSAAFSFCSLGANCTSRFRLTSSDGSTEQRPQLHSAWVGPGYFGTLGMTRMSGREFSDSDTANSPRVAIISESLARQYFAGDAIGKRLGFLDADVEIVGVAGDIRGTNLRQPPVGIVYLPIAQPPTFPIRLSNLDVRVSGDAARAMVGIGEAIHRGEPGLFVERLRTMSQLFDRGLLRERLVAYLSWGFGALALLLACVGVYGVMSYAVTTRTKELGVRTALGARPIELARMIVREASYVVLPGVILGAVLVRVAGRFVESLLFGVTAFDVPTYVAVIGVLAAVAIGAALVPARRAATVDPVRALQTE